jgi:hypothetical protein
MKTALTTTFIKLDIPVSFLLSPDIYRTGNQHHPQIPGKPIYISTIYNERTLKVICPWMKVR